MAGLPRTVDVGTLAALLDLTDRRIHQLVREGVLPKAGRGKYPVADCVQAYVGYWQRQAEERAAQVVIDYKAVRARKVQAEAELKELELGLRRGELVPTDAVEAQVRDALEPVDIGLRTVHNRLSREWAEKLGVAEGEAVHLIKELADQVRAHLVELLTDETRDDLPEDLPWRSLLEDAGVTTLPELLELEDLTEIRGIGPARARQISEAVA